MKTAGSVCWRRRGRHSGGGLNLAGFWHSHKTACWSVVCCWTGKSKKQKAEPLVLFMDLGSAWRSSRAVQCLDFFCRLQQAPENGCDKHAWHSALPCAQCHLQAARHVCAGRGGLGAHPSLVAHTTVIISYLLKVLRRATHLNARRVLPAWRADL